MTDFRDLCVGLLKSLKIQEAGLASALVEHRIKEAEHALFIEPSRTQPMLAKEKPWELKGWCDEYGYCWIGAVGLPEYGTITRWVYDYYKNPFLHDDTPMLPHDAIPLPSLNND